MITRDRKGRNRHQTNIDLASALPDIIEHSAATGITGKNAIIIPYSVFALSEIRPKAE